MLAINKDGKFKEIKVENVLTGERSLEDLNKATPFQNNVVATEMQIAKDEQRKKFEKMMTDSKKEKVIKQKEARIKKEKQALAKYNKSVIDYNTAAYRRELDWKRRNELLVEEAALDFAKNPNFKTDQGFKTTKPLGRANVMPSTDYEKIVAGSSESPAVEMGAGGEEYISYEEYQSQVKSQLAGMGALGMAEEWGEVQDQSMGYNFLESVGIKVDSDRLKETANQEANNWLNTQITNLINPPKSQPAPQTQVINIPGQTSFVQAGMSQTQKYILYGVGALAGISVLALIVRAVRK